MNLKNLTATIAIAAMGVGTAALADDSVKLSCPAGSKQQLLSQQDFVCQGADGSRPAGPMVMLYPSGKKMAEGQVTEGGFRTGTWVLFNEQGVKTHVIEFKRGNFDGQWVEFHPNGQKKTVQQFKDGKRVGSVVEYDQSGKVIRSTTAR